ncbi:hypothetical protein [Helicobacter sp. WB40]|uniref:hypothetical protein n=1 Tax=Helicobacter sp. WB40 TaxID=3004130 RepID=UPI0022EBBE42|nr:hypothetical protein [Helicobacter sp. WB40]MDA3966632.1 hypothetical protein [Helicobacter sp. WB40]
MLLEKLQKIEQIAQDFEIAKEELLSSLPQRSKEILKDDFKTLSVSFKDELKALQNLELESLKTNTQEQVNTKLNELFFENLENIVEKLEVNLPLNTISQKVALEFKEQNRLENIKVINEAISNKEGEYYTFLDNSKKEIEQKKNDTKDKLDSIPEVITNNANSLLNDFLSANKNELLSIPKDVFIKYLKENGNLESVIESEVKEVAENEFLKVDAKEELTKKLEEKAEKAFVNVLDYKHLVEQRFMASLHLQAVSLQSELFSFIRILEILSELKYKKLQLEKIKELEDEILDMPKQNIFKVI